MSAPSMSGLHRKRNSQPKAHISGRDGGHTINLHQFARGGVVLLGRIQAVADGRILLAQDLKDNLAKADKFEADFVKNVDEFIAKNEMDFPEETLRNLRDGYNTEDVGELSLKEANITSVIWATGYGFDFGMVRLPVFDSDGFPIQTRGATRVVITGRRRREGRFMVLEIVRNGGCAAFMQADLSRPEEVRRIVPFVIKTYGRLDYAFNNAGTSGDNGRLLEQTEENFDHIFSVNVKALFLLLQDELRQMSVQGQGGSIVNAASVGGLLATPAAGPYVMWRASTRCWA